MSDWEESKQNFIDKLGNADRIFDEIFKTDSEGLVIQGDEREELKNLQTANKKNSQQAQKPRVHRCDCRFGKSRQIDAW